MRSISAFAFVVLSAVILFGGGNREEQIDTIRFARFTPSYGSGGEEWINDRIRNWGELHGMMVEMMSFDSEGGPVPADTLIKEIEAVDLCAVRADQLGTVQDSVVDLYRFTDDDFVQTLLPAYRWGEIDGRLSALVWNPVPWVLLNNRELARKAGVSGRPKDFTEFMQQAKSVGAIGENIRGLGLEPGTMQSLYMILWEFDGELIDSFGKPVVASTGTETALNMVKTGIDEGILFIDQDVQDLRAKFINNELGFLLEGVWATNIIMAGEGAWNRWDVVPWPGEVPHSSNLLCISRQSEYKDLAWELIHFLATDEITTEGFFVQTGLLPIVAQQYDAPLFDTPIVHTLLEQMGRVRKPTVWCSEEQESIEAACMEEFRKIFNGRGSAEEVLLRLEDELYSIITQ